MPVTLTPRIYRQRMKWLIVPKNKIDTITAKPVLNTLSESQLVKTIELTDALPVDPNAQDTHNCIYYNINSSGEYMAVGGISATVISGEINVALDTPINTPLVLKMSLDGNTKYINRNKYPLVVYLNLPLTQRGKYISDNADGTTSFVDSKSNDINNKKDEEDNVLVDYTKSTIPNYPFVRTYNDTETSGDYHPRVAPADILTDWRSGLYDIPKYENWLTYGGTSSTGLYGNITDEGGKTPEQRIAILKRDINIQYDIVKVDDYNYTIKYAIPVRYVYYAAAAYKNIFGNNITGDSYAFIDLVSKITFDIYAETLSEETQDISYSLDDNNTLTSINIKNKNILNFSKNEFITLGTTYNGLSWLDEMSEYILTTYKNGKYIIDNINVPAQWAIDNDIHINSGIYVETLNNKKIQKLFLVKNIEKSFSAGEFIYKLKLLEE